MDKKAHASVSYGYQRISLNKARQLADAWLDKTLPESQWQIVAPIIKERVVPRVVEPVVEIIKRLEIKRPKILDVGCSSGFYYDFLKWAGLIFDYVGCDVSPEFIFLAKKRLRWIDFRVASITKLPYKSNSFDLVLASGVLHYELNYLHALSELTRVSSRYILLHRLPIFATSGRIKHSIYKKYGYGIEMMEMVFDWKTLNQMLLNNKLI